MFTKRYTCNSSRRENLKVPAFEMVSQKVQVIEGGFQWREIGS